MSGVIFREPRLAPPVVTEATPARSPSSECPAFIARHGEAVRQVRGDAAAEAEMAANREWWSRARLDGWRLVEEE